MDKPLIETIMITLGLREERFNVLRKFKKSSLYSGSERAAYSAPLVRNPQHYHWYAATYSPSPSGS